MKNLVILYGGDLTRHAFEKSFGGFSAFERVLDWAARLGSSIVLLAKNGSPVGAELASFCDSAANIQLITKDFWTKADFIAQIASSLKEHDAGSAIVSHADTPFLNERLTRDLLEMHEKYAAEYSFADGFPYGLAPELIEAGTVGILAELARTTLKAEGEKPVDREAIFSVMRGDINSFEIETLIADCDYRLLRFSFDASSKINALACKNLFCAASEQGIDLSDACALSNLAAKTASVMQTVPAFYNIQISSRLNHECAYSLASVAKNPAPADFMDFADFQKIIAQITDFSENAVISLSAFGEPLLHPEFLDFAAEVLSQNDENHHISLLIETDGLLVTDGLSAKIAETAETYHAEVNWIVCLDATEKSMYAKLHHCGEADFEKALASVALLENCFPHHVYPQFVRMKANESQLEAFFRFWKETSSPSQGELIIQKYNDFCHALPDEKPADLSPVERFPCWHLRRDMTVLADGSVPFCAQLSFANLAGNILSDGIGAVWARFSEVLAGHIERKYSDNCSVCDESYTFNF